MPNRPAARAGGVGDGLEPVDQRLGILGPTQRLERQDVAQMHLDRRADPACRSCNSSESRSVGLTRLASWKRRLFLPSKQMGRTGAGGQTAAGTTCCAMIEAIDGKVACAASGTGSQSRAAGSPSK